MAALRELFARFTTEFDGSPLVKGAAQVDGLFGKLKSLGTALLGGAIVGGVTAFTTSVIHAGDELGTAADRLSLTTQALQEWRYVAGLADVENEELSAGFRVLQKNVEGATSGGKDAAADFAKLGLTFKDLKSGDLDAILTKSADGFAKLTNPIERTALAQKLFGRGGAALVPLLAKGSDGIRELKDEFAALGGGLNDETIAAANEADDAFKRLQFAVGSLTKNAVTPLILLAVKVATQLKDWVKGFNELSKGSNVLQAALLTLGAIAAAVAFKTLIAFAPVIAPFLAWAAAIAAVVLILDDLITLFKGGNSIIGEWIDQNIGAGAAARWVQDVKTYWDELQPSLLAAWESFKGMLPSIEAVADALNVVGNTIAFLVTQYNSVADLFTKKGGGTLGKAVSRGVLKAFGSLDATSDEQTRFSEQEQAQLAREQKFFDNSIFGRFEGRSQAPTAPVVGSGAVTIPEVTVSGDGGAAPISQTNNTTINVPPGMTAEQVKTLLDQHQDAQNRKLAASIRGT